MLILPYRKGQRPADLDVKQDGAKLTVTSGGHTTTIDDGSVAHRGPGQRILITLAAAPAEFDGLRIAGGPSEVVLAKGEATLTVGGPAGLRQVSIPGPWAVKDAPGGGVRPTDAGWEVQYDGGPPRTIRFAPAGGQ